MDLSTDPKLEDFRAEVRAFFAHDFPKDILEKARRGASLTTEDVRKSEKALGDKGWLAAAWPVEHGGPGWSLEEQYVFDEELERAGVPTVTPMGVIYVGPILYTFGTDAQKERWLPGIREGREGWAQGYSEPEAGSDLASLQFSAVREGDEYVLNGTKIWTSAAQHADWIFCLARTDNSGKKQEGISFIISEMDRPGITVTPIITIDGKHALNQVTFENVRVPADYLIGEEGKGWTYSQYLLGHERTSYARIGGKRKQLAHLREIASAVPTGGNSRLIDDPAFARKLTEANLAVDALEMTVLRVLSAVKDGGAPGKEASIVKVLATTAAQQITTLYLDAAGLNGVRGFADSVTPGWLADDPSAAFAAPGVSTYFGTRAQSIYGGTNEIQRGIIAKRVLGL
ncbi:acyl-CoA dehydrogenase family protein [Henriciella aquimarina]|uniref:acyl-CoA dehydrogenase family protein n=1 Tax=Henriciella aquimarina TaxID=545261 RepID=UPI000A030290|nr:acyl-CoA dehydrogenase family protein [Henriciella aquimarina]